ncbi:Membrane-associated phospholipid phosphatase [Pseudomonas syringae pv. actinidiae]|uniref:Membrane-associated phospholipid phosphatase n=1 Tax=Pseudomonas syringae pv. actinidiae TaxID=103796 RepID=A0A2V0QIN3_PSESF|nr:Membrane-associated phospholipid phosphatase [Pseudomonas syringae pv. actinidiae]
MAVLWISGLSYDHGRNGTQSVPNCIPTRSVRNDRCLGEPAPLLILAYGRGSELARDLPGTGSKTVHTVHQAQPRYPVSGPLCCLSPRSLPQGSSFTSRLRQKPRFGLFVTL